MPEISLLDYWMNRGALLGVPINAIKPVKTFHTMISRVSVNRPLKIPSSYSVESSGEMEYGAIVLEPRKVGLIPWIAVMDFAQFYPRIMVDWNVGLDAVRKDGPIRAINRLNGGKGAEIRYADPEEYTALLPSFINELMEQRWWVEGKLKEYPKGTPEHNHYSELKASIKNDINSVYGVNSNKGFRLRDGDVATTVTATARHCFKMASDVAEEEGLTTIYGHTDSIFFQLPVPPEDPSAEGWHEPYVDFLNKLAVKIDERIHKWQKSRGVRNPTTHIEPEAIYKNLFIAGSQDKRGNIEGKKNRYVADNIYDWKQGDLQYLPVEKRLKIRGFETRRSNASLYTKALLKQLFVRMMSNPSQREVLRWLHKEYTSFLAGEVFYKLLLIPSGISKMDPNSTYQPVRAAFYGINNFDWTYKSKAYLIYVRMTAEARKHYTYTNVLALPSPQTPLPAGYEVDWRANADTRLLTKVESIVGTLGIRRNDIVSGSIVVPLEKDPDVSILDDVPI